MNWLRKINERVYHHFIKFTRTLDLLPVCKHSSCITLLEKWYEFMHIDQVMRMRIINKLPIF